MSTPYDVLFGLDSLSGKVDIFGEDVTRTREFQSKFFNHGRQLTTRDGNVKWDEVTYSRGLAPVTGYRGRSPNKTTMTRAQRQSAVAVIKQSVELDPERLFFERATGQMDPNAEAYVNEEMADLTNEVGNTIEYFAAEACRGTLTVNNSNIPGSTQSFTLTFSPNTYTQSAAWNLAGTGILSSEIPALKVDFEQNCGLSPAQAMVPNTVEGYFFGNTEVTGFVGDSPIGGDFLRTAGTMRGPLMGGLRVGGLSWIAYEGGYVPSGGSFTRYLPTADQAIVLPEDGQLGGVLGYGLGQALVPQQLLGPAQAASQLIRPASPGWFAYAMLTDDGFIKLHVGWVGILVPIRPDAICVADLV